MTTFKETRELLVDSYINGDIDEDEFVVLYDANTSKNPVIPYVKYDRFDLDAIDPAECNAEFRFEKRDLIQLAEALGIPEVFVCDQRSVCDGLEGMCIALRRFAYSPV